MKKYSMAAAVLAAALLLTGVSACSGETVTEEEPVPEEETEEATPEEETEEAISEEETEEDAPEEETEETAVPNEETEEDAAPEEEEPATLEFVDAHGEWHETEIADAVEKHAFDWDHLSGSGPDLVYEDDTYTSRVGIDVSEQQGTIDWQAVRDAGVTFAFVRIGGRGYGEAGTFCADARVFTSIADA